jgi:hypothetical protein
MRRRNRKGLGGVGLAAVTLLVVAGWLWVRAFPQPPAAPE